MEKQSRRRFFAVLLGLGACILLMRTVIMLIQDAFNILAAWVVVLLFLELILDIVTLAWSIRWAVTCKPEHDRFPLRTGAAAAILHAIRVLIFVLGRTGPWVNFDVRPEQRSMHAERWTWGGMYFAAVMSVLGIAGVIVIWRIRQSRKRVA